MLRYEMMMMMMIIMMMITLLIINDLKNLQQELMLRYEMMIMMMTMKKKMKCDCPVAELYFEHDRVISLLEKRPAFKRQRMFTDVM